MTIITEKYSRGKSPWNHFSFKELMCKCGCGTMKMDSLFMDKLEELRVNLALPIYLSSAYRCPKHNDKVSKSGSNGPHTTGRAVDIICYGDRADVILGIAYGLGGFSGKGIYQKNKTMSNRFIHLDDLPKSNHRHRPWLWG